MYFVHSLFYLNFVSFLSHFYLSWILGFFIVSASLFPFTMDWIVSLPSPPPFKYWSPNPLSVTLCMQMGPCGECSGLDAVMRVGSPMKGLEETPSSLSSPSASQERVVPRNSPPWRPVSWTSQHLEVWGKILLLFRPPSLWYFIG